jgi:hypothetical protein
VALGVGALCVLLAGAAWATERGPRDYGPLEPAASSPALASTPSVPPPAPPGDDTTLPGEPTGLRIGALGVSAPIDAVDQADGVLEVPPDPRHVGWWVGSALAGSTTGSVVLDGHVDSAAGGPGALFRLRDLAPGDLVEVDTVARRVPYVVVGRRVLPKSGPLPAELFSPTGPARLVLVTCGGPFDARTRSYEDNVAVIAAPRASR